MLRNIFSLASTTAATKLPCHSARRNYLRSNPLALIRCQFIRMESNSSSYRPKILITRSDIPLEAIKILEEKYGNKITYKYLLIICWALDVLFSYELSLNFFLY